MKLSDPAKNKDVLGIIRRALHEDIGTGDITTGALVSDSVSADARIVARGNYVVCGTTIGAAVFKEVDADLTVTVSAKDGRRVSVGGTIAVVRGWAKSILTAERTALNFMQRMTGIATLTDAFVQKVKNYGVTVLDTRKTTPGLRVLEKYAVLCGGGRNHRMGLYDMVLIKDNHKRLWSEKGGLGKAVAAARKKFPDIPVEVEVENEAELKDALDASPEWILLDNMPPEQMKRCVELCAGRSKLEASGGITLGNVDEIARTGVDAVSLGCLTHSAPAADLSLELE